MRDVWAMAIRPSAHTLFAHTVWRLEAMGLITAGQVGQVVVLKEPHPCGGRTWTIYKLGLDVGLQCRQCGHRIKLKRRQYERAVKAVMSNE